MLSLLGGRPPVRLTRLSGVWEPGIVLWRVYGVYRRVRRGLNGTYGGAALRIMASAVVVVGLVLGLGVQDDRRRLDLGHLVLLGMKNNTDI